MNPRLVPWVAVVVAGSLVGVVVALLTDRIVNR